MTGGYGDRRPALPPPRFGLATLMLTIGLLCTLFALMGVVGPVGVFVLLLATLALVAHVAGNAIGTQLRRLGDTPEPDGKPAPRPRFANVARRDFAPAPRLGERYSLGLLNVTLTSIGVVIGGAAGGIYFLRTYWEQANPVNIGIGMLACAALAGMGTFIVVGFVQVMASAVRQATRATRGDKS